jgi:hypothetical protein
MARVTGLSQSAVSRLWRARGLKPHRVDYFKISTDPDFVKNRAADQATVTRASNR